NRGTMRCWGSVMLIFKEGSCLICSRIYKYRSPVIHDVVGNISVDTYEDTIFSTLLPTARFPIRMGPKSRREPLCTSPDSGTTLSCRDPDELVFSPAASALSTMCFISAGDTIRPSISNLGMGFLIRSLLIFGIFLLLQIYNYHIPIPLRSVCTNPKNCRTRNRWPLRDCLAPPGYRNTPICPLRDVPHPVFEA